MLSERDKKIISELRSNSRAAIRDIAKKTGLRPSTVHQRITTLKEEGVIERFTIKLNNKAAEENFIVFMLVNTKKDLPDSFLGEQCIKEAFGITGEHDIMLKLKFKDLEEFNSYIIRLRKNKSITKTTTMVSTITLKEEI